MQEGQSSRGNLLALENGMAIDKERKREKVLAIENGVVNDKGVYVGVEEDESGDESEAADEDLGNIWSEMAMSIVCSKVCHCSVSSALFDIIGSCEVSFRFSLYVVVFFCYFCSLRSQ